LSDPKCVACKKEIAHGMYLNSAAGIDLCEKCSAKVTKHFVDGYCSLAEMECNTLQRAKQWINHLLKTQYKEVT